MFLHLHLNHRFLLKKVSLLPLQFSRDDSMAWLIHFKTCVPFAGSSRIDVDSAQNQNSVLQGQEQMTLRSNLTKSNDSGATVQNPMLWSPSANRKGHALTFQQRSSTDNWMHLGRRETDFKDVRSTPQSFGDSQALFMQPLDDNHSCLNGFNNQFHDQGPAHRYADPYFFMPPQPSLTVETSTRMHTAGNELRFWNDQNGICGNSSDPQAFRFGQNPSSWLSQPYARVEQPRVVRPQASVAPFDLEKTKEGSGFKIFGFKVDAVSASPIPLNSPMAAMHEDGVQTQPSALTNEVQPVQTECLPEVSVSTAGVAAENEKSGQQGPQSSNDVQSKSHGASTRSCTKVLIHGDIQFYLVVSSFSHENNWECI
jgi:hypothetical protein